MVNVTFNNISVISWWSVLLVKETGVPRVNHRPVPSHWQTLSHNVVSSTHRFGVIRSIIWPVISLNTDISLPNKVAKLSSDMSTMLHDKLFLLDCRSVWEFGWITYVHLPVIIRQITLIQKSLLLTYELTILILHLLSFTIKA